MATRSDMMHQEKTRKSLIENMANLAEMSADQKLKGKVNRPGIAIDTKRSSLRGGMERGQEGPGSPGGGRLASPRSPKSPGLRDVFQVSDKATYDPYGHLAKQAAANAESNPLDTDWVCMYCNIVNNHLAPACKKCGANKNSAMALDWICGYDGCNGRNDKMALKCVHCGNDKKELMEPQSPKSPGGKRKSQTYRGSKMQQIGRLEQDLKDLK